jgi:hypothetical protein
MAELGSFCTSCGAKQEPGGTFCTSCGAKREVPVAVAVPEPPAASSASPTNMTVTTDSASAVAAAATNIPPVQSEPVAAIAQSNATPAAPVPSVIALSQRPKGSGSKAIFIVLALVILLGAAFGGWKYRQKSTRVEIEVSPDATQLPLGGSTHVEAEVPNPNNVDVIWSVKEGSGGTVTGAGALAEKGMVKFVATYNAPNTAGTYHVVATLSDNSESTGETTITVGGAPQ